MMCALDQHEAMGPEYKGIYVVEFESEREASTHSCRRVPTKELAARSSETLSGDIDQFLVVKGPDGKAQKEFQGHRSAARYPTIQVQKARSNPVVVQNVPPNPRANRRRIQRQLQRSGDEATPKIPAIPRIVDRRLEG